MSGWIRLGREHHYELARGVLLRTAWDEARVVAVPSVRRAAARLRAHALAQLVAP